MKYQDLPVKLRKQVDAALGAPARQPRRSQRAVPVKGGRWRCTACGNVEKTLSATEKHADEARHARYECLLDGAPPIGANALASPGNDTMEDEHGS